MRNPNFAVFGIVEMPGEKIVLVQERGGFSKPMWKLPGGRPKPDNGEHEQTPEYVLLREINDETGLTVEIDELIFQKQLINRNGVSYDFIVYICRYYSGELKPEAEIERCEAFNKDEILKLIFSGEVLPIHDEALKKYIQDAEEIELAKRAF